MSIAQEDDTRSIRKIEHRRRARDEMGKKNDSKEEEKKAERKMEVYFA